MPEEMSVLDRLEYEAKLYQFNVATYLTMGHELSKTLAPGEYNDYYHMAFSNSQYATETYAIIADMKAINV